MNGYPVTFLSIENIGWPPGRATCIEHEPVNFPALLFWPGLIDIIEDEDWGADHMLHQPDVIGLIERFLRLLIDHEEVRG